MAALLRSSRLWVVAGALLAAVLVAATYLLVVAPARAEADSVRASLDDATLQQSVLRRDLRALEDAAEGLTALQASAERARGRVPDSPATGAFLRELTGLAHERGVAVGSVVFGEAEATDALPDVAAVTVSATLTGPAEGLVDLVGALQNDARRLLTVDGAQLDRDDGGASLRLDARIYCTTPETTPETTPQATPGTTGVGATTATAPTGSASSSGAGAAAAPPEDGGTADAPVAN